MKKKLIALLVGTALSMNAMNSFAQEVTAANDLPTIRFATGDKSAVFSKLFTQIAYQCSRPSLQEVVTTGGAENMEKLLKNGAHVGLIQTDSLFARKMIDNDPAVDAIKTLMPMFGNVAHIVTLRNSSIRKLSDMGNKKVGVFGSAVTTQRVMMARSGVSAIQVIEYKKPEEMLNAIAAGQIDVGVGMGAYPLPWVENMNSNNFRLVAVDTVSKMSDVYKPRTVTYPKLGGSVATFEADVILATQDYKSKTNRAAVLALRDCMTEKIDDLRETPDNHPIWRVIDPTSKASSWPYYEGEKPVVKTARKK